MSDGLWQCLNVGRCRDEEKTSEDECTIMYCVYGHIQCAVFSSNKAMSRLYKLNTWRQTVRSAVETPIANHYRSRSADGAMQGCRVGPNIVGDILTDLPDAHRSSTA